MTNLETISELIQSELKLTVQSGYGKSIDDFMTKQTGINAKDTAYIIMLSYSPYKTKENGSISANNSLSILINTKHEFIESTIWNVIDLINDNKIITTDYGKFKINFENATTNYDYGIELIEINITLINLERI